MVSDAMKSSHEQRLWFEGACYKALLGIMIAFAVVGVIGVLMPPGLCVFTPDKGVCTPQFDWGANIVSRASALWPVLLALGTFLVGGPAVTLFRGAHDAALGDKP